MQPYNFRPYARQFDPFDLLPTFWGRIRNDQIVDCVACENLKTFSTTTTYLPVAHSLELMCHCWRNSSLFNNTVNVRRCVYILISSNNNRYSRTFTTIYALQFTRFTVQLSPIIHVRRLAQLESAPSPKRLLYGCGGSSKHTGFSACFRSELSTTYH